MKQGEIVGLLALTAPAKDNNVSTMVLGIVRPDSGRILIDNEDLTDRPMYLRARRGIGYLPQEASVFRSLTARENIELVLEERGKDNKKTRKIASDLIEEFGLGDVEDLRGMP